MAYEYAISKDPQNFKQVMVSDDLIEESLGTRKYNFLLNEKITKPGVAIGLAYTSIGGSALLVETTMYPGSGQLKLTGKLGEVMKESVNTCISWIQFNSSHLGIINETNDSHILDSDANDE